MKFTRIEKLLIVLMVIISAAVLYQLVREPSHKPHPPAATAPYDCVHEAVIFCGVHSKPELAAKVQSGEGIHDASNIRYIYEDFGIHLTNPDVINSLKTGVVDVKDQVLLAGKVVAKNVRVADRTYTPGSAPIGTLYMHHTKILEGNAKAYVYMEGGKFKWAIIEASGDVVVIPRCDHPNSPSCSK